MTKEDKPEVWMPLYISDWESDTAHLSCEEDGAYGRLVRRYWRNGPPPDDDVILARIVRMELRAWKKVRSSLVGYFTISEGLWTHKRVEAELVKWSAKKAEAIARAKAAAEARWSPGTKGGRASSNATSMPGALLDQCPLPSPREVDAPIGQSTLSDEERYLDLMKRKREEAEERSKPVDISELRERIMRQAAEMAVKLEAR